MLSGISGYNPYSTYGYYGAAYANRAAQAQNAEKSQSARPSLVAAARRAAQPEALVQPVTPARPVSSQEDPAQAGLLRYASDPAAMAVRMRIQYPGSSGQAEGAVLPGVKGGDAQQARGPVPGGAEAAGGQGESPALSEAQTPQEVMEEAECQTCKERKYQDGSDDPGVSFKTATNIAPEQVASAVRGHENEHVVREQAKAQQEGRKVVSQSVTIHNDICPECGKVYVSGGTTRTVTKAAESQPEQNEQDQNRQNQNPSASFFSVA